MPINYGFHETVKGMTLMDHFAGQALSGILSDPESMRTVHDIAEERGFVGRHCFDDRALKFRIRR